MPVQSIFSLPANGGTNTVPSAASSTTAPGRIRSIFNSPARVALGKTLGVAKTQEQQQLKQQFTPATPQYLNSISSVPELKNSLKTGGVTQPQFLSRFAQLQNAPTKMNKYSVGNIVGGTILGAKSLAPDVAEGTGIKPILEATAGQKLLKGQEKLSNTQAQNTSRIVGLQKAGKITPQVAAKKLAGFAGNEDTSNSNQIQQDTSKRNIIAQGANTASWLIPFGKTAKIASPLARFATNATLGGATGFASGLAGPNGNVKSAAKQGVIQAGLFSILGAKGAHVEAPKEPSPAEFKSSGNNLTPVNKSPIVGEGRGTVSSTKPALNAQNQLSIDSLKLSTAHRDVLNSFLKANTKNVTESGKTPTNVSIDELKTVATHNPSILQNSEIRRALSAEQQKTSNSPTLSRSGLEEGTSGQLHSVESTTTTSTKGLESSGNPKPKLNLGEEGSVAPGQAPNEEGAVAPAKMVSDIKDFTAKRQAVKTTGKDTSDKLFKLTQENKADTDKATAILKDTKAATPADWEAVYHYREDPSSPVTPFQKALHDQVIKPLYDSVSSKDESANYQHRINIDKRGPVQSLLKGKFKGMGSNLLRQTTDSEKQRSMKVLTDDQGNRTVVHIGTPKNDLGKVSGAKKVTAFNDKKPTNLGPYRNEKGSAVVKNGDKFTAKNGKTYTVGEATTKEIEQHTNVKYSHNSLANALDHVLKTKSATRAKQFLEDWKTSSEFKQIARSVNDSDIPDHYVPTQAAQFRGYVFEPKIAHHLDDFAGNYAKDPLQAITGLNKFVTTTIFMNPIVHLPNEIFFGLFNRGLSRNIPGLGAGKGAKALGKAFTGVIKNSKDYEAAQRAGMPTMSRGSEAYQRVLQKTIGKQLQDPNIETRLIKAGISSPKRLASAWMHSVHTLTWMTQDVINYQAVLESEARGMSRAEAIDKNFTHGTGTIPDYRKPTTILGSRNAQQVITNPNISVFTTYHLNALKSFMNTGKTLIARDTTIKDKATALDRLAMLGVLSIALSAGADKLAQSVTGNPNAEVRRPGPLTIPTAVVKAAEGKIGVGRLATDIVTPPPGTKTALQLGNNKDQYGNQIFKPSEIKSNPKQAATDAGKFAAGAISPFQVGQRAAKNPSKTLASILGISQPQSDTNNKVYNLLGQQLGSSGMSVDVQRTNAQKNSARQQIASGKGDSQARDLVNKGVLTKQGLTDFKIKAKWTPLQRAFDSLSPANKLDVLNSSKPGDMNGLIVNKHNLLLSLSNTAQSKTAKPETKIAANQLIKKLGGNQGPLYLQYRTQQKQKHFLTRFAR